MKNRGGSQKAKRLYLYYKRLSGEVKMYMKVIRGLDPELFAQEFNKACEGFNKPKVQFIDSLTAYVYGEEATPKWEYDHEPEPPKRRKCAECGYYEWGKRCLKGEGHKYPGTEACKMFYDGDVDPEEISELVAKLKKNRVA